MDCYKTINNSLIGKKGYLFAGLGILLTFIYLILVDLLSNYYKASISFELLKTALNNEQYDRATEISISRLDPSFTTKILNKYFFNKPASLVLPAKVQYQIFGIENLIIQNKLDDVKNNLKVIKNSFKTYGLLNNKNILKSIENLEQKAKTLILENKNFLNYKIDIENLEAKKIRILRRHTLLADEFGIFLSLKPNYKKGTELAVYNKGVLFGLPILKNLKDDIPSLIALKEELDKIGGVVSIQAQNAYEVFAGRILSIRETSNQMRKNFEKIKSDIALTRDERNLTKKSIKTLKKDIQFDIKNLILLINK